MAAAVMMLATALLLCTVVDGDTLRCGAERVRLIGIDAPEMPGHCRASRVCTAGDGAAARDALERLIGGAAVEVERHGRDRYGRTLARVRVAGRDLSCAMVAGGWAVLRYQRIAC